MLKDSNIERAVTAGAKSTLLSEEPNQDYVWVIFFGYIMRKITYKLKFDANLPIRIFVLGKSIEWISWWVGELLGYDFLTRLPFS
jgi:hypothetical protein